jgi:hypothetical protein
MSSLVVLLAKYVAPAAVIGVAVCLWQLVLFAATRERPG